MAETTEKTAERVYTLDDIKFNEANKAMAALSCIPIVGLIMLFVEKDDLFVRYIGAQSALVSLFYLIAWFPIIGWLLGLAVFVALVVMFIKVLKGERFDVPVVSNWALKVIAKV